MESLIVAVRGEIWEVQVRNPNRWYGEDWCACGARETLILAVEGENGGAVQETLICVDGGQKHKFYKD